MKFLDLYMAFDRWTLSSEIGVAIIDIIDGDEIESLSADVSLVLYNYADYEVLGFDAEYVTLKTS